LNNIEVGYDPNELYIIFGVTIVEQSVGIILHYSSLRSRKIALLDKKYGRIDGIAYSNRVVLGALVHYNMRPNRASHVIDDMNIHEIPMGLARQDILFLHHVLELCYQLIPVNSCVDGVFDLLMHLYSNHIHTSSLQHKKLFLFKLLTTLSIYPSTHKMLIITFDKFVHMAIDSMCNETLDLESEKELDMWLHYCITEHVQVSSLRTIHFLIKNRVL
jgi:hypothetical protein